MAKATKKSALTADLNTSKLYAHTYALRLAKQVAQEPERSIRDAQRKKKPSRNIT